VNSSAGNVFKVEEVDKNSWAKGRRSTGSEARKGCKELV